METVTQLETIDKIPVDWKTGSYSFCKHRDKQQPLSVLTKSRRQFLSMPSWLESKYQPMTTKRFAFKSSKLSSAADQLWSASKSGFKADEKNIKLDLGKTLAKDKPEKSSNAEATKNTVGSFVFGSKLSEKVIISKEDKMGEQTSACNSASELIVANSETRGDVPKSVTEVFEEIKQKGASSSFIGNHKSKESVAELEAISASSSSITNDDNSIIPSEIDESVPPKLDVVTGEEGEINIYRAVCKLHSFDSSAKSWVERGMSCLRINERGEEPPYTYRIVGRVMGNQRVVLNSQIFPDMIVEKLSMRRVKFSATAPDSEVPALFLATASEFVAAQLYGTLSRIVENKKKEATRKRKFSDMVPEQDNIESAASKKVLAGN
ncbi:RanBP1 domain-containing protein [Loa loa]|uniref:RanBP1 domain-containing protein n=1 Tax=Loa loa TaxID=7209 RepID=A0A1I7VQI4_LOALO|nr:RanBP1 domain-containing protein [Loa loa]EFO20575.2 RanBP1 domain-containing protein [Loa loa]